MSGWIKLHRSLKDWEWYGDKNALLLLIHLLVSVNYEDKKWRGVTIKAGSMVLSWETLSTQTGLTIQQCRTAMSKLEASKEVTRQSTNRFQVVSLVKWDKLQSDNKQITNKLIGKQQTNNKQITTTKEYKEYKETKELTLMEKITRRKTEFSDLVFQYQNEYNPELLQEFIDYWTEHGIKDRKMRFEKEKSFSVSLRLNRWFKNQKQWKKEKSSAKKEKKTLAQIMREREGIN